MTTSKPSTPPNLQQLTFLPEDSLASLSVQPGSEKARKMTATSGQRCLESYRRLLPAGSSVRTLAAFLLGTAEWYSTKCLLTWKPRVTKSGRTLFQLAVSVPRTGETESGLLPTPRVSEAEGAPVKNVERSNGSFSRVNRKGVRFGVKVKDVLASGLIPTVRANEAKGSAYQYDRGDHNRPRPTLTGLLATPQARDWRSAKRVNSHSPYKMLNEEIAMLPTPATRDYKGAGKQGQDTVDSVIERGARKGQLGEKTGRKLQPAFALWMMGYPEDWCDLKDGEMPLLKPRATPLSRK